MSRDIYAPFRPHTGRRLRALDNALGAGAALVAGLSFAAILAAIGLALAVLVGGCCT